MSQINIANGNNEITASQNTVTKNNKEITYQEALKIVCKELNKDKEPGSIYHGWQSNIACIFMDCNNSITHGEANVAAKIFLNRLIGDVDE